MTTPKGNSNETSKENRPKFVNYDFDESTKKKFKSWRDSKAGQLSTLIDKVLLDGYNISCKADDYNDCVAAYLSPTSKENPNYGWFLAGRGRTGSSAILGVLYRHMVIFEGIWPLEDVRRRGTDED